MAAQEVQAEDNNDGEEATEENSPASRLPTEIWWEVLADRSLPCTDVLAFKDFSSWCRKLVLSASLWRKRREAINTWPAPTAHSVRLIPFILKLTLTGVGGSSHWNHVKVCVFTGRRMHTLFLIGALSFTATQFLPGQNQVT